ncbi:MAG: leucyl/phenylalanyl-tRNA--protein transferase [Desulfovibrio sp.]|nr:leucyl/phenylalanyl-tRNA--protein transferase [Desulfovibrio sp.]
MNALIAQYVALFPRPEEGREDGLLCTGGDLHPARLLAAYSMGIFPWYDAGSPILWWSPDPRCILLPTEFRLPRRSARVLRRRPFELTLNAAFGQVIRCCAQPRESGGGTWITPDMITAYELLHELGYAHSVEAWRDGQLAGGLYGVALGKAFFGESMFCRTSEASRAALAGLVSLLCLRGATLLDCQQQSLHIMRMGGCLVSRREFLLQLQKALPPEGRAGRAGSESRWQPWEEHYDYSVISGSWISRS